MGRRQRKCLRAFKVLMEWLVVNMPCVDMAQRAAQKYEIDKGTRRAGVHAGVVHLGGAVDEAVIMPVDLRCGWDLHIYQVLVMGGCEECGVSINIGLFWLKSLWTCGRHAFQSDAALHLSSRDSTLRVGA